jgi:uncharacterized protein (DUF2235 family)
MSKQIIFCADGTWNGPADHPNTTDIDGSAQNDSDISDGVTNVIKLFANLSGHVTAQTQALHDESEKEFRDSAGPLLQIAKYMHGVGDSSNAVMKVLGGVFGAGVIARIVRGYTFISRNYLAGDSIHILGFSRGAYTARALGGMIASVGLLNPRNYDPDNKSQAYLRGLAAWLRCKGIVFAGDNKLSSLLTALTAFAGEMVSRIELGKNDLIPGVRIKSVAVWDTVGSLGIPNYVRGNRGDFFSFVDRKLSPWVDHAFHAMALDERRLDFPVTRWDADPRVEQVWFVGAHSDVGGGYPLSQCGLSDIALDWMMQKLAATGVSFAAPPVHPPDMTRLGQDFHTPWTKPPFNINPQARASEAGDVFHPSVAKHWNASASYQKLWPKGFQSSPA